MNVWFSSPVVVFALLCLHVSVSAFSPGPPHIVRNSVPGLKASFSSPAVNPGMDSKPREEKKRLSRPERKALERERKQLKKKGKHRKHNFAARAAILNGRRAPGEGRYELHSSTISQLTKDSTPDDVVKAIKRAQNLHDVHDIRAIERFLMEEVDESFAYGYRGSLLARLAVAALHMENHQLARKALEERRAKHQASAQPLESAAIVRGLLRVHNVSDALYVLEDELPVPNVDNVDMESAEVQERIKHRCLVLASLASRHFFEGHAAEAVQACEWMGSMGSYVKQAKLSVQALGMPWYRIVQGAATCESARRNGSIKIDTPCNLVYAVLNAMAKFPPDNDDRTYEALSNALVRRVVFITGAVDMSGCPPADRGEVAFIGRSNVGKSSLVNMITNRKSLAFTSKTPGKTQQFNYFAVNDKHDREREVRFGDVLEGEKDADSFYIVDLPGFGFAKVPDHVREDWSRFMSQYIARRETLRVLFHLVDARHGPTDEDQRIMQQVGKIVPKHVRYVVVLTKADKNAKGPMKRNKGKVSSSIMDTLRETLKTNNLAGTPIVLSSAESKLGRDEIWRFLRLAAEA